MKAIADSLGMALFGQTRRRVLGLFFTRPDESFHLREIARLIGGGLGGVQREVSRLASSAILVRTRRGNQTLYRANADCPIFSELRALVVKTAGVADVLKGALAPLAEHIELAFVFGSFARGEHRSVSDVDLMVVAEQLGFAELVSALKPAERQLGREINPSLYRRGEIAAKLSEGHHFLRSVLGADRIWLIGSEDELSRIESVAAMGLATRTPDEQTGDRAATDAGGA